VKKFGGLHIAVNNAGVGGPLSFTGEYPIETWYKIISINLSVVFYGMRYQIPARSKSGESSIVIIAYAMEVDSSYLA
jgi:NAD(P)-dependent dehydrogenase (short-subunit alcohol dehydrogenase family)